MAAAKPGLADLGKALTKAIPAVSDTTPLVEDAARLHAQVAGRDQAVRASCSRTSSSTGSRRTSSGSSTTSTASLARYDSISHLLSVLLDRTRQRRLCGNYATTPVPGCSANYGGGAGDASPASALTPLGDTHGAPGPGRLAQVPPRSPRREHRARWPAPAASTDDRAPPAHGAGGADAQQQPGSGPGRRPATRSRTSSTTCSDEMRGTRKAALEIFDNPILIGTVTILVGLVAVYLSYIAENGLPFVPTYNVNVDVAERRGAGQERRRADRRRARRPGADDHAGASGTDPGYPHPFARLGLSLQTSLKPLPVRHPLPGPARLGARRQVPRDHSRPRPQHPQTPALPDGGTFHSGHDPAQTTTSRSSTWTPRSTRSGPRRRRGLRSALGELGDAVAGRGDAVQRLDLPAATS